VVEKIVVREVRDHQGRRPPRVHLGDELVREALLVLRREVDADAPGAHVHHAENIRAEGGLDRRLVRGRKAAEIRVPREDHPVSLRRGRHPRRPIEDRAHQALVLRRRGGGLVGDEPREPIELVRSARDEQAVVGEGVVPPRALGPHEVGEGKGVVVEIEAAPAGGRGAGRRGSGARGGEQADRHQQA
jgi:hypothetical protein